MTDENKTDSSAMNALEKRGFKVRENIEKERPTDNENIKDENPILTNEEELEKADIKALTDSIGNKLEHKKQEATEKIKDKINKRTEDSTCPYCGWADIKKEPVDVFITDRDKEEWIRCLYGGLFTKEFVLFDGKLKLKFRTKKKKTDDAISTILLKETEEGKFPTNPFGLFVAAQTSRGNQLGLASSVAEINDNVFPEITTDEASFLYKNNEDSIDLQSKIVTAYDFIFSDMNSSLYEVIIKYYAMFERVCNRLREVTSKPDFF